MQIKLDQSRRIAGAFLAGAVLLSMSALGNEQPELQQTKLRELGRQLEIGDVVFIRIPNAPFTKVAATTSSWTNHVGIVSNVSGAEPMIAESRVPLSGATTWTKFVKRSDAGRVAVTRLPEPLDAQQQEKLKQAVAARQNIRYDTGFDLHSSGQFCSRYVREVLHDAAGVELGEVENFSTLLDHNPEADQQFWKLWYFGQIPWQRETVTPASLLRDGRMRVVFDGRAK
ncbi:MAG: YebB family permuted papain-like enzyme [Sideroxyarcus sp.]|nr:YebB family permuted papain-like enzyme [Sideroxyarcus sp.]